MEGYTVEGINEKVKFNITTTTAVNYYIPRTGSVNTARMNTSTIVLTATNAVFPLTWLHRELNNGARTTVLTGNNFGTAFVNPGLIPHPRITKLVVHPTNGNIVEQNNMYSNVTS